MPHSGDADLLLERLYEMLGARDTAFVADLLQDFLAELPGALQHLAGDVEREDWAGLRAGVHKLRSSAQALGGVGIAAASIPLEAAARAGDAEPMPLLMAALMAEIAAYEHEARLLLLRIADAP
jgi:HPt (histidine-containing phosphotransfer) domain-containing protein